MSVLLRGLNSVLTWLCLWRITIDRVVAHSDWCPLYPPHRSWQFRRSHRSIVGKTYTRPRYVLVKQCELASHLILCVIWSWSVLFQARKDIVRSLRILTGLLGRSWWVVRGLHARADISLKKKTEHSQTFDRVWATDKKEGKLTRCTEAGPGTLGVSICSNLRVWETYQTCWCTSLCLVKVCL